MDIVLIKDINQYEKKKVRINGWVYNSRRSGKIGFLMLRDGYGIVQCIIENSHVGEENFKQFKSITLESLSEISKY